MKSIQSLTPVRIELPNRRRAKVENVTETTTVCEVHRMSVANKLIEIMAGISRSTGIVVCTDCIEAARDRARHHGTPLPTTEN